MCTGTPVHSERTVRMCYIYVTLIGGERAGRKELRRVHLGRGHRPPHVPPVRARPWCGVHASNETSLFHDSRTNEILNERSRSLIPKRLAYVCVCVCVG